MARQNYFEWMFHPIAGAQFVAQSSSKLDPKEISCVRLADDGRAYPISQMLTITSQDVVAGMPIGHVLNALSHRSGVDANGERKRTALLSAGINNQNFLMRDAKPALGGSRSP